MSSRKPKGLSSAGSLIFASSMGVKTSSLVTPWSGDQLVMSRRHIRRGAGHAFELFVHSVGPFAEIARQ